MVKKILFVCLGNICRSPAAEGILKKFIEKEKLNGKIQIDSAGLLDYHKGETYDPRMIAHSKERGYKLEGTSRPFVTKDFEDYDSDALLLCSMLSANRIFGVGLVSR